MELTISREAGVAVLAPRCSRIDHFHAEEFQAALAPHLAACRHGSPSLVLDLSAVEYISSVGLRALMLAARQAEAQGGRIAIAALQPLVREVFAISRFDLVFRLFDTPAAAAEALA